MTRPRVEWEGPPPPALYSDSPIDPDGIAALTFVAFRLGASTGLPTRAARALERKYRTVGAVVAADDSDLRRLLNFGESSLLLVRLAFGYQPLPTLDLPAPHVLTPEGPRPLFSGWAPYVGGV